MRLSDFLPYPHDLDEAPQLAAVALLWANLVTVERALVSAHPCLAGEDPVDREEILGAAILSLAPLLRRAINEYRHAIGPRTCAPSGPIHPAAKTRGENPF